MELLGKSWSAAALENSFAVNALGGQSWADASEKDLGDLADEENEFLEEGMALSVETVEPADLQGMVRNELEGLMKTLTAQSCRMCYLL